MKEVLFFFPKVCKLLSLEAGLLSSGMSEFQESTIGVTIYIKRQNVHFAENGIHSFDDERHYLHPPFLHPINILSYICTCIPPSLCV